MSPVADAPHERTRDRHASRCLKWSEIDWAAPPALRAQKPKTPIGPVVLKMEDLKKYYSTGGGAFGGGAKKLVKANETLSFEAHEGETLAIVFSLSLILGSEISTSSAKSVLTESRHV